MGVDVRWVVNIPAGHRFHEDDLCAVIRNAKIGDLSTNVEKIVTVDGKQRFISISSFNRWADVTSDAEPMSRHIYIFQELSILQEILEDLPLYYSNDFAELPGIWDTEAEAVSILAHYTLVDEEFTLNAQILSLEAEAKEKADGTA